MRNMRENLADTLDLNMASDADHYSLPKKDQRSCDELLQRFFSELGHSPCLTDQEEYQLTSQAQASWGRILTLLTQGPQQGTKDFRQSWTVSCPEQLCERDVVSILTRGKALPDDHAHSAPVLADFSSWLKHLDLAVSTFREARDELVQRNLRLVFKIARQYRSTSVAQLDLIQEGIFGLMRAIEKFDPAKGFRLSTYAGWWIRQAISRALNLTVKSVRLTPTTVHDESTRVTTVPVILVSIDTPISDTESPSLAEILSCPDTSTPEELLLQEDQRKWLQHGLNHLAPRDAAILRLRFGLTTGYPCTLEEVGRQLQIGREQVRRREERALGCLRHLLQTTDTEQSPASGKVMGSASR